ncbi:metallophosphoesterase [Bacillus anthracis]|nr:metallophosphoesterase [Bacillus anthracis]
MNIRFLQLSDVHFHHQDYNTIKMRDELITYLGELKKEASFNCLLVTGDIANKGDIYNDDVKEFLNSVIDQVELSKTDVHIIPGNHDVSRNKMRSFLIDGILGSSNPMNEIDNVDPESFETLLGAQSNFFTFYKEFLDIDYPKEELHFLRSSEYYNILSMNTCLISHKKGEEGSLLIGRKRFYGAISKLKKLETEKKINIAIGHHTLDCIDTKERSSIRANFDDAKIDIYISGHVHDPAYNVTINSGDSPFVELTSGAVVSDEYAIPGFVVLDVNLDTGDAQAFYHIWNKNDDYWTVNNQVGRRTRQGKLDFSVERLKKKDDLGNEELSQEEPESSMIDENEFKQFIIDFHEKLSFEGPTRSSLDNKVELDNKFYNMKCSATFQKRFEVYAQYFGTIYNIMDSTSYVRSEKKDLIAEIIIDKYLEIHNRYGNGDEIFKKIVDQIIIENEDLLTYSKLTTNRYVKILTAWSIYECDIFNENKRCVEQ